MIQVLEDIIYYDSAGNGNKAMPDAAGDRCFTREWPSCGEHIHALRRLRLLVLILGASRIRVIYFTIRKAGAFTIWLSAAATDCRTLYAARILKDFIDGKYVIFREYR